MKKKKRPITLLEIMIVIFLIGLIGGVIGYNMKGSLDKGRAFKTEQGMSRIKEILLLQIADGYSMEEVISKPEDYLRNSGLCDNPKKMLRDGWNENYTIEEKKGEIAINSEKLIKYYKDHPKPNDAQ